MPFILFLSPLVFLMAVWVVVSFYRIMRPEEPQMQVDPGTFDFLFAEHERPLREPVMAGASAIRERGRRQHRTQSLAAPYDFLEGQSAGFPQVWLEDVHARRN